MHYLKFLLLLIFSQSFIFCQNGQRAETALKKQKDPLEKALQAKGLSLGDPVFIRIFKESKELEVWIKKTNEETFTLFKTYPICTYGGKGLGPKLKEGDGMAPEGFYYVPKSKLNPNSRYHLAFNLGYPNDYDQAHERTGSALMVHGDCVSIGCYAMTDPAIEEIYTLVKLALEDGQKYFRVHIFPFRMEADKMREYIDHQWYDFWRNLQEGYRYFEEHKIPPNVEVEEKRYTFR
jgi:murein L,D-transpeptidase YafK